MKNTYQWLSNGMVLRGKYEAYSSDDGGGESC